MHTRFPFPDYEALREGNPASIYRVHALQPLCCGFRKTHTAAQQYAMAGTHRKSYEYDAYETPCDTMLRAIKIVS